VPDPADPQSEVLGYWQKMFDDLKDWYKVADSRASGIISINSILVGFITISTFLSLHETKNQIAYYLLPGFFSTIMVSIILAIYSLWGRKRLSLSFFISDRTHLKNTNDDEALLYFGDIIDHYKANECNKVEAGSLFVKNEFCRYTSKDKMLKAIATQIVILSSDLYKRFWILNISYILIVTSIILMSVFTFVRFVLS
jgi:hypothetical protein